jgi:hypothetical protein
MRGRKCSGRCTEAARHTQPYIRERERDQCYQGLLTWIPKAASREQLMWLRYCCVKLASLCLVSNSNIRQVDPARILSAMKYAGSCLHGVTLLRAGSRCHLSRGKLHSTITNVARPSTSAKLLSLMTLLMNARICLGPLIWQWITCMCMLAVHLVAQWPLHGFGGRRTH